GYQHHCEDGNVAILRNDNEGIRISLVLVKRCRQILGRENVIVNIDRKPMPRPKRTFYKHFNND
ncbi:MAG: hypothetical protein IJS15_14675, partial [Victivallales bacterium]|nr:hypothetical protein [Victivallales bacterium]